LFKFSFDNVDEWSLHNAWRNLCFIMSVRRIKMDYTSGHV
jgi:hypothetical protein